MNPPDVPLLQIELLADRPEFIAELAQWHHAEWAYLRPGFTLDERIAKLHACTAGRLQPPAVFIASEGGQLLGSAMLVPHDMDSRPDLSPWLAGVFTLPEFRGRGIATQLCARVVDLAAQLGFPRLYLFTPSAERFYARLGWSVLEQTRYRETAITIMSHQPPA